MIIMTVIATVCLVGAVAGALRAWHTGGRVWLWIVGVLVFAVVGGVAQAAPRLGVSHAAAVQGLPLADNPRLMLVYLNSGQSMVLDAAVFPVAIVSVQDPSAIQRIAQAYNAIKGSKRPIWLVVTGFASASPKVVLAQIQTLFTKDHIALPWAAQIGPATLYTPTTPALITEGTRQSHRIMGLAAVLKGLSPVVSLTSPAVHLGQKPSHQS